MKSHLKVICFNSTATMLGGIGATLNLEKLNTAYKIVVNYRKTS